MPKKPRKKLVKGVFVFYPTTAAEIREFWEYIARRNREGLRAAKKHQVTRKPRKGK